MSSPQNSAGRSAEQDFQNLIEQARVIRGRSERVMLELKARRARVQLGLYDAGRAVRRADGILREAAERLAAIKEHQAGLARLSHG